MPRFLAWLLLTLQPLLLTTPTARAHRALIRAFLPLRRGRRR